MLAELSAAGALTSAGFVLEFAGLILAARDLEATAVRHGGRAGPYGRFMRWFRQRVLRYEPISKSVGTTLDIRWSMQAQGQALPEEPTEDASISEQIVWLKRRLELLAEYNEVWTKRISQTEQRLHDHIGVEVSRVLNEVQSLQGRVDDVTIESLPHSWRGLYVFALGVVFFAVAELVS